MEELKPWMLGSEGAETEAEDEERSALRAADEDPKAGWLARRSEVPVQRPVAGERWLLEYIC